MRSSISIKDVKQAFQAGYIKFFSEFNQNKEFRKKFNNVTLGCQLGMFEKFIDEEYNKLIREKEDKPVNITIHLEDIKNGKLPTVSINDYEGLKILKEGLGKD